jgi:cbb3-type cytochrome oxidase subunit 3
MLELIKDIIGQMTVKSPVLIVFLIVVCTLSEDKRYAVLCSIVNYSIFLYIIIFLLCVIFYAYKNLNDMKKESNNIILQLQQDKEFLQKQTIELLTKNEKLIDKILELATPNKKES